MQSQKSINIRLSAVRVCNSPVLTRFGRGKRKQEVEEHNNNKVSRQSEIGPLVVEMIMPTSPITLLCAQVRIKVNSYTYLLIDIRLLPIVSLPGLGRYICRM